MSPVEGPQMGGVRLVDWCICGPTHRALKTRSRSGYIFFFFNNNKNLVLLFASVERFGVSCIQDFSKQFSLVNFEVKIFVPEKNIIRNLLPVFTTKAIQWSVENTKSKYRNKEKYIFFLNSLITKLINSSCIAKADKIKVLLVINYSIHDLPTKSMDSWQVKRNTWQLKNETWLFIKNY